MAEYKNLNGLVLGQDRNKFITIVITHYLIPSNRRKSNQVTLQVSCQGNLPFTQHFLDKYVTCNRYMTTIYLGTSKCSPHKCAPLQCKDAVVVPGECCPICPTGFRPLIT